MNATGFRCGPRVDRGHEELRLGRGLRLTIEKPFFDDYERWESMLDRLEATFPGRIHNTAMCLTAGVRSPAYEAICRPLGTDEAKHNIGFSVSFLVPWYVVYGWRWSHSSGYEVRFDLDEAKRP